VVRFGDSGRLHYRELLTTAQLPNTGPLRHSPSSLIPISSGAALASGAPCHRRHYFWAYLRKIPSGASVVATRKLPWPRDRNMPIFIQSPRMDFRTVVRPHYPLAIINLGLNKFK
jgi:hypothetical protein